MFDISSAKVIKRGICLYDNAVEYEVVIVESNILYGSGDYEDLPDIANDKEVKCYYGCFDSPGNRGVFSNANQELRNATNGE